MVTALQEETEGSLVAGITCYVDGLL